MTPDEITDEDRLSFDPFDGDKDDCGAVRITDKIVIIRKEQTCWHSEGKHTIQKGERARLIKEIWESKWHSTYLCVPCIDKWLTEGCGY